MSGFINSVVRGAGFTIGRNIVGDFGKSQKPISNRYYDRAENEMEKALNFPIKGRSETILGSCFNMYQAFDDDTKSFNKGSIALLIRGGKFKYYKECLEKLNDCKEYLELKNKEDENIQKLDEIYNKVNNILFNYVDSLSKSILNLTTSKDKEVARGAWFGYSDGYNSAKPLSEVYPQIQQINPEQYNPDLITEIESHLKKL